MAQGPYSRIYHVLMDEYPSVWRSDAQLALFVRLLIACDKWYPQWVPVGPDSPIASRNGAYQPLLRLGLVLESADKQRCTVRGLEAERERRSEPGRKAAAVRWQSARNANAMPDEKSRDEKENIGANASNGTTFMGWRQRQPKDPENGAGLWGGKSTHDGRHGKTCAVCAPLLEGKTA